DGDDKLACVLAPDNCEGVTCNQHGTCELDEDNSPYCECEIGYGWDGENKLACVPENVDYKPVIYLYPSKPIQVNVQFAAPEDVELLYTYPEYDSEGWCVNAHPDGTLYDCQTGLEFYALFWEGITPDNFDLETGFVVKGSDTVQFLEEKLALLGLNRREANEFIMYWLPVLERNPWNFIHFARQSWTDSVPLLVEPEPDTSIRFLMLYSPLDFPVRVKPQKILPPKREGFTLVEWGGRKVQY
ncbi:MAG: dockerin type I repeat-containing protein, partial [Myxococcota bacterium]